MDKSPEINSQRSHSSRMQALWFGFNPWAHQKPENFSKSCSQFSCLYSACTNWNFKTQESFLENKRTLMNRWRTLKGEGPSPAIKLKYIFCAKEWMTIFWGKKVWDYAQSTLPELLSDSNWVLMVTLGPVVSIIFGFCEKLLLRLKFFKLAVLSFPIFLNLKWVAAGSKLTKMTKAWPLALSKLQVWNPDCLSLINQNRWTFSFLSSIEFKLAIQILFGTRRLLNRWVLKSSKQPNRIPTRSDSMWKAILLSGLVRASGCWVENRNQLQFARICCRSTGITWNQPSIVRINAVKSENRFSRFIQNGRFG